MPPARYKSNTASLTSSEEWLLAVPAAFSLLPPTFLVRAEIFEKYINKQMKIVTLSRCLRTAYEEDRRCFGADSSYLHFVMYSAWSVNSQSFKKGCNNSESQVCFPVMPHCLHHSCQCQLVHVPACMSCTEIDDACTWWGIEQTKSW